MIVRRDEPGDYVLATGESHTVREFTVAAYGEIGRAIEWRGKGVDEEGIDKATGRVLVKVDPRYFRPTELFSLCGDASKAQSALGWRPRIGFAELVRDMVRADVALLERQKK